MPWCERCDRFLNPNTVTIEGTCPTCGRPVDASRSATDLVDDNDEEKVKAPWHFWLMMVAVVIYLGWRLLEGVWWAIQQVL